MDLLKRPSKTAYFMGLAAMAATRGTCARRRVGVVFTDINDRVVSTGYNGTAPGAPHCIDQPCAGADAPSGERLDDCCASHAELSGLAFCPDPTKIFNVYCTTAPCPNCMKTLSLTNVYRIYFLMDYPGSQKTRAQWESMPGREWIKVDGREVQQALLFAAMAPFAFSRPSAADLQHGRVHLIEMLEP